GDVFAVEDPGHPQERGESAGPLEQRRLAVGGEDRVEELRVPVHTAAERLVLALAAAAEAVVLQRGPRLPRYPGSVGLDQFDAARNPIRAVPGDLDCRFPRLVDVVARLVAVDGEAQGAGGAGPDGLDDLVEPAAAGGDEGLRARVEDRAQTVGAEAG